MYRNRRPISSLVQEQKAAEAKAQSVANEKGVPMIVIRTAFVRWGDEMQFGEYRVKPESEKQVGELVCCTKTPAPAAVAQ